MPSTPNLVVGSNLLAGEHAFLNLVKNAHSLVVSWPSYPEIYDAKGYVQALPTTTMSHTIPVPSNYNGRFVIKWTGKQRMMFAAGTTIHEGAQFSEGGTTVLTEMLGTNGRLVVSRTNPAPGGNIALQFWNFEGSPTDFSNFGNLVICREADEAAIDAGEYLNPDYVQMYRNVNPRIWRPLGWNIVGERSINTHWAHRAVLDRFSYRLGHWHASAWVGQITGTNDYVCAAAADTPAQYTDGEMIQGYFANTNTSTAVTIDVGSRGPKTVKRFSQALPVAKPIDQPQGGISSLVPATLRFDAFLDQWYYEPGGVGVTVPYEVQCDLCNQVGCDLWINVPTLYTDASLAQMAQFFRDKLDPRLNFYFEWSNEVWNNFGGFEQTFWSRAMGTKIGWSDNNDEKVHSFYALKSKRMFDIFENNWAGRSLGTLRPMMTFQTHGPLSPIRDLRLRGQSVKLDANGLYTTVPGDIVTNYSVAPHRPVDKLYGISHAPYIGGGLIRGVSDGFTLPSTALLAAADDYDSGDVYRMRRALDFVDFDMREGLTNSGTLRSDTLKNCRLNVYPQWQAIAAAHKLPVLQYEGGPEMVPPTTARLTALGVDTTYAAKIGALIDAYKDDERFRVLMRDCFREFMAISPGGAPSWLLLTGGSKWSAYKDDIYGAAWKSLDALIDINHQTLVRM